MYRLILLIGTKDNNLWNLNSILYSITVLATPKKKNISRDIKIIWHELYVIVYVDISYQP